MAAMSEQLVPRKSPQRLRVLAEIVADSDAGRSYRWAAAIEPNFFGMLDEGGYIEIREEGRHPLGGPSHRVYATDAGRELLQQWSR